MTGLNRTFKGLISSSDLEDRYDGCILVSRWVTDGKGRLLAYPYVGSVDRESVVNCREGPRVGPFM